MLNNKKETKYKSIFAKKATHGVQKANIKDVELSQDKNGNNFLTITLSCETGEYTHRVLKPYKSEYLPYDPEDIENVDTIYWETCDKIVDEIYKLIRVVDVNVIDEEGFIVDNFATEYRTFIENLKSGTITVTEDNYKEMGFVKARHKRQKVSKAGNDYTSYDFRIVGVDKNTWYEETGTPKYTYAEMIGEKIGDYTDTNYWNDFFEFVYNYFVALKKNGLLDKEFMVKLIRVEVPDYEKDSDGKFIKIDNKKIVKAINYYVGTPQSQWFKEIDNSKFELKLSKSELETIQKYEELVNATNTNSEIGKNDDFPF